jgi:hypothetical protein
MSERDNGAARGRSWISIVAWSVCAVSTAAATLHVARQPQWNLDGVLYAALMHPQVASVEELHAQVYAAVEREVPKASLRDLTQSSNYRRRMRESADAFAFQLGFYVSKPLYLWIGRALTAARVSVVVAPYAVSAAAFGLIGLLLPLFALRAGARPEAAAGMAAAAIWLPQLQELGVLATPDALATALITCGAALSLPRTRGSTAALAAAVLARPDAAIVVCAVLIAACLREPTPARVRQAVLSCAIAVALAVVVMQLSGGYGWPAVMRHTFIQRIVDGDGLQHGLSMDDYLRALDRGVHGAMTDHIASYRPFLALAALGCAVYMLRGRQPSLRPGVLVLVAVWAGTAMRFLAMPLLADRFFAAAYLSSLAVTCAMVFSRAPSARLACIPGEGEPPLAA